MSNIAAVILAGGRSSRMGGGDKSLVLLRGRPLLSHLLERIKPQASSILINSNSDPSLFTDFGLPVRADALSGGFGPLAGILTGMTWAAEQGAAHLLSIPCDTPFLPQDLLQRLGTDLQRSKADIAVARDDHQVHPVIALWPVQLAPRLAAGLEGGTRSVFAWLRQFRTCESQFAAACFSNLNTQADLLVAERKAA
jgi:molybdopterin-guanine dinucleotide biosynthesis protein A